MEEEMLFDTIIYYEIYSIDEEENYVYETTLEQVVDFEWSYFWQGIQFTESGTYEIVVTDEYGLEFGEPIASGRVIVDFE
jgi:hypothetical protein